jgi:predicted RNase H-like HicB family nuclease
MRPGFSGLRREKMQIPILIEPVSGNGYRVTTGQPLTLSAEGATREEALRQLHQALQARLSTGAEITCLEVSAAEHPLAPYAGMFKDNPLFDAWQQAIAEYRHQVDGEQEGP